MAARGILLTAFHPAIISGTFQMLSWGPFSGRLTVTSIFMQNNDPTLQRTSMGLFIAQDDSTPSGPNPFVVPPGWQTLGNHADQPPFNLDSELARFLPFQTPSIGTPLILTGLAITVTGQNFYLKCGARNSTATGIHFDCHLGVTLDTTDPGDPIDPRIDPPDGDGGPGPVPPPPVPPGGDGDDGDAPGGDGTIPLPMPSPGDLTIPPIPTDPADPVADIRTRCV